MAIPSILDRLDRHQSAILAIIDRSEAMLASDTPDTRQLATARWELQRALLGYQMFKHRELFDPRIAAHGTDAAAARQMKDACLATGTDFTKHVTLWSTGAAGERWDEYRRAAKTMTAQLRQHIARERRNAIALLAMDERLARF